MTHFSSTIKYFIYARKSSESDEKQVQSIDDQTRVLDTFTKSNNLQVVDILTEARSAKEPHSRPVFEALLKRIKQGEANGIIVWKIDRLSRNPIDSATIQWLLQKNIIQSIRTPDRDYRPEDNVLILSVESSMATQYILDLSKNVKRGLKSKIEKGWRPSRAPLGYLNTKTEIRGENYITKDPNRFAVIRKAWDLMLSGGYQPTQILNILNNTWGLRTRKSRMKGGAPLTRTSIYKLFSNVFYAGLIKTNDYLIPGKHEPMITIEEFDRVQYLLGRKGRPRPSRHEYAYTGLLKCGDCNGTISATYKKKLIHATGVLKEYSLYYCFCASKQKNDCKQKQYVNSELLDQTIEEILASFTIDEKFKDWALNAAAKLAYHENETKNTIKEMQVNTTIALQKQLTTLAQLRIREMIDDEEFIKEKIRIKNELTILESKNTNTSSQEDDWIKLTKEAFEFNFYALKKFQSGTNQTKREILMTISSWNCTLKDKILNIPKPEWLIKIKEGYETHKMKYSRLELENNLAPKGQNADLDTLNDEMCALVHDVGTIFQKYPEDYKIVNLNGHPPP